MPKSSSKSRGQQIPHQTLKITHQAITLVQTAKGKVTHKLAKPLAAEIIEHGYLKQPEAFTGILSQLLSEAKLSSRLVAVCLPEHQTFIKTVLLEKTNNPSELTDSIMWQVSGSLSMDKDNLYIDWAIVSEVDDKQLVQVVGIPRSLVDDYIQVLHQAGLAVATVTTPSSVLAQLAGQIEHPALLIDASDSVTVAASQYPNSVSLTAVIDQWDNSAAKISLVIQDMLKYYHKHHAQDISKAYITGSHVQPVQANLPKQLQVTALTAPDISAEDTVDYLIAEKPIQPPGTSHAINLVPPDVMADYQQANLSGLQRTALWLSAGFLIIINLIVGTHLTRVWSTQQQLQNQTLTSNANTSLGTVELVVRVQDTNAKITIINKVGPHRQKLVQALTQIINIIPDDIQVTGITLDALSNAAQISGQGADQATILSLKQALEEVDNISEVKLPLSVFEKQQNIIFTVSFQWLPETNT